MGFRVKGLGSGGWSSGCRGWGVGVGVQGAGCWGVVVGVEGVGCRVALRHGPLLIFVLRNFICDEN